MFDRTTDCRSHKVGSNPFGNHSRSLQSPKWFVKMQPLAAFFDGSMGSNDEGLHSSFWDMTKPQCPHEAGQLGLVKLQSGRSGINQMLKPLSMKRKGNLSSMIRRKTHSLKKTFREQAGTSVFFCDTSYQSDHEMIAC